MWTKWLPWRYFLRSFARANGYMDPVAALAQINHFSQPAEVLAPTELLRLGMVLHIRGLMNGQAIQHNLDWVWPYWAERQFDPKDVSFVPRAFSLTHINLTHRNWTAVGLPDVPKFPLVDPRGLLTPHYDGWSLDAWILKENGEELIPSREAAVEQRAELHDGWAVTTRAQGKGMTVTSRAEVVVESGQPVCRWTVEGLSGEKAWLVVSLRPYNPEGVSFIHSVETYGLAGWMVNGKQPLHFDASPDRHGFSFYRHGDIHRFLPNVEGGERGDCRVGMATAAALFDLSPGKPRRVTVRVPFAGHLFEPVGWPEALKGACRLRTGYANFQSLYDAAVRTMVLHSPGEVYPGPYTYRRFWFRDAAFILNAMLCVGLSERVRRAIDRFPERQKKDGYFLSQEGEWDSNGQALWILQRYCELTGEETSKAWRLSILRAARWILRKRLSIHLEKAHAGLLPAGFSAEHFGPNDFYYWDDFWGVAGLRSAAYMAASFGDAKAAHEFETGSALFFDALRRNLNASMERIGSTMIPASPYRRMDAGAIGGMVMSYPLRLCPPKDDALLNSAGFLIERNFIDGGFFQEISHSGINPYLTLHVAQALLRAGDPRFFGMMHAVAKMASPTGQWPEAVHPKTRGGCMGDGQHVWAAAEWAMMVRNCFVREEDPGCLVLCQGITPEWYAADGVTSFGPAPTPFGPVSVTVRSEAGGATVSWEAVWRDKEPLIEISMPGFEPVTPPSGASSVKLVPASAKEVAV